MAQTSTELGTLAKMYDFSCFLGILVPKKYKIFSSSPKKRVATGDSGLGTWVSTVGFIRFKV